MRFGISTHLYHERKLDSAQLKELAEFGFRDVRVRGAAKIMAHLMFGLLALTVDQLLKLTG